VPFGLDRQDLSGAQQGHGAQAAGSLHRASYKRSATAPAYGGGRLGTSRPAGAPAQSSGGRQCPPVQESPAGAGEFGRSSDPVLAAEAASLRYALYDLEADLLASAAAAKQRRRQLAAKQLYLISRSADAPVRQLRSPRWPQP